jgi:hypothetical protein
MRLSDIEGICSKEKRQRIHEFADFCCDKLGIEKPSITLKGKNDTASLGYTDCTDGSITIVVSDRHQMDIMRTLAHELVHCKQLLSCQPDGTTGSADENEANAMAGVLMRDWGGTNPHLFSESSNNNTPPQHAALPESQEQQELKVIQTLDEATMVVHKPSDLINMISSIFDDWKNKSHTREEIQELLSVLGYGINFDGENAELIKDQDLTEIQRLRELAGIQEKTKKDACYRKVRSRYKVWPSAYASGALVQCRKKGAKNWGNKK